MSDSGTTSTGGGEDAGTRDQARERSAPPEARVASPGDPITAGEPCEFDGSASTDPDGDIREYLWAVERDGEMVGGDSGRTFVHAFDRPGNHQVHLTVTDEDGLWDTTTVAVRVEAADR